jgi:hypothetical protein
MGLEILLLMLVGGPGIMVYGLSIIIRGRVRLSRRTTLTGDAATIAGLATMVGGFAFTCFLWSMTRYLRH